MADKVQKLSGSMEDYLEVIHALSGKNGMARVGAIALKMKVRSPSVHAALRTLAARGLVEHERYGCVALTPVGRRRAAGVQRKHDILFRFLTEVLMLEPSMASREACAIEHAISAATFSRLVRFFRFLEVPPPGAVPVVLSGLRGYLKRARG
jgi:DtxR family Mn-dependent transcriptional regulator